MNKRQLEVQKASLADEENVIRQLKKIYAQARKDCESKIREFSMRTDMENLKNIIWQKRYQEVLKEQLDSILDMLNSNSFTTIADYLAGCYENGFFGTLYDLQGQGIPLIFPINQEEAVRAVQLDSQLSEGYYKRLREDITTLKHSIRTELSRGISNGKTWNQMAVYIANGMNSPFNKAYNNALRIARTEGHRIQQESTYHCQQRAKSKGADIVKQWDSTLDGVTRPHHVELDGQVREVDEAFEVAGMKAMYPGAFGIASEDIHCRCCLLQRARRALSEEEYYDKWDGDKRELVRVKTTAYNIFKEQVGMITKIQELLQRNYKELTLEEFKAMHHIITNEERVIIYGRTHFSGYINSSNARKINGALRNRKTLSQEYQKIVNTLQSIIDRNVLQEDIRVVRFVNSDALESLTGVSWPKTGLNKTAEQYFKEFSKLPEQIQKGKMYEELGFLSTSGVETKNVMTDKGVRLNIFAPKGTHAYVTTNYRESEIIFGQSTRLNIIDVRVEGVGTAKHKVVLDCIIEG